MTVLRFTRCTLPLVAASVLVGCIQEMSDQPRLDPYEHSLFFDDGSAMRHPPSGTVARGQLQEDDHFFQGRLDGKLAAQLPAPLQKLPVDEVLHRGQQRYRAFCTPCHGEVGGGRGGDEVYVELAGMAAQRGFPLPQTFHQPRLRTAPLAHFFDVITHGRGKMPSHGYLIPPQDRWSIAAYVRALQISQYAPRDQLTDDDRRRLAASLSSTEDAPQP